MEKKRYLITGGTGFIGSSLVKRLINEGHSVRILDNNFRGSLRRLSNVINKVELVQGDIRNETIVRKACENIESVIHLAFINGTKFFYTMPEVVLDVGVRGMLNVIDACIKNNVKELILASSSEVYQTPPRIPADENVPLCIPDPLNPRYSYAGSKIISELIAINYGRKYFDRVVIFRPHNVYGPDMGQDHVIPQFIIRMKEICHQTHEKKIFFPIQGSGKETRAFVFIDDFIDGLLLLLEKGKHLSIYNIGSMEEVSIKQVAQEIAKYFGREVTIIPGKLLPGSTIRRCPDITKLMSFGYKPKIKFKEGIKITAKWYDENGSEITEN